MSERYSFKIAPLNTSENLTSTISKSWAGSSTGLSYLISSPSSSSKKKLYLSLFSSLWNTMSIKIESSTALKLCKFLWIGVRSSESPDASTLDLTRASTGHPLQRWINDRGKSILYSNSRLIPTLFFWIFALFKRYSLQRGEALAFKFPNQQFRNNSHFGMAMQRQFSDS